MSENDRGRRMSGLILGAAFGLIYGLAAQISTVLALPGIPYDPPPLGPLGNIALSVGWGAALGVLTAWPTGGLIGMVLGSVAAALAFIVRSALALSTGSFVAPDTVVTGLVFLLPVILVNAPAMALLRWAAVKQATMRIARPMHPAGGAGHTNAGRYPAAAHYAAAPEFSRRDRMAPLLMAAAIAGAGALSAPRAEVRTLLGQMHTLIQTAAGQPDNPPPALQPVAAAFAQHAGERYGLRWAETRIDSFGISRPAENYDNQMVVTAQFSSGWTLACLYATPEMDPICRDYAAGALP